MNQSAAKQHVFRLVVACGAVAGLWIGLVKPARADLSSDRDRLALQLAEIDSFETEGSGLDASLTTIARIDKISIALESALTRPSGAAQAISKIEKSAATHGVRIRRSDPKSSGKIRAGEGFEDAPELYADSYAIDLIGTYTGVVSFVEEMQTAHGLVDFQYVRMTPAGEDLVACNIEIVLYRLGKDQTVRGGVDESEGDEDAD